MMHMTFYWGRKVTLLFDSWKTDSWADYGISLFVLFLLPIFYQYLESHRIKLSLVSSSSSSSPSVAGNGPLLYSKLVAGGGRWGPGRFAEAILFGVNSAIGYLLMLSVMTFNGGVFVAAVLGLAGGYLVFRSGHGDGIALVDNPCACA